jgi:DNA-binding transcriptional LysR family regulator
VERLFDETLVLVSTDAAQRDPDDRYVYVDWGPAFDLQHAASYPDLERTALTANIGWLAVQLVVANGGSCFLPERMAAPEVAAGRLFVVPDSPRYRHPAYLVHPLDSDSPVLERAVAALREMAKDLA